MQFDAVAVGIDTIVTWLAFSKRDSRTPLCKQIRAAAMRGDKLAKRVISSGILNDPAPPRPSARRAALPLAPVPDLTPNQRRRLELSARAHAQLQRDIELGLVSLNGSRKNLVEPHHAAHR